MPEPEYVDIPGQLPMFDDADVITDRTKQPHPQGEGCATNAHCVTHNVDEIDQSGDYRVCGECGHIFRTEGDLIEAEIVQIKASRIFLPAHARDTLVLPTDGATILSCPFCTHSF